MISEVTLHYLHQAGFFTRPLAIDPLSKCELRLFDIQRKTEVSQTTGEPFPFYLFNADLSQIQSAKLLLDCWQIPELPKDPFKTSAKSTSFIERNLLKKKSFTEMVSQLKSKSENVPLLILLPTFPTNESNRKAVQASFEEKGIQAALSFRSILRDTCSKEKGENSQPWSYFIKVLKTYDLLRTDQLEFFQ